MAVQHVGVVLGLATIVAHLIFLLLVKQRYDLQEAGGGRAPDWVEIWIPIFLTSIACEALYLWYTKRQRFRVNDAVSSLGTGLVMQSVQRQTNLLLGLSPYAFVYHNYRLVTLSDSWLTWLAMFLGVEFCYYWLHRTSHTIATLWASHHVHHSSEEYNFTTALRQSTFHGLLGWSYYMPLAFFMRPSLFHAHAQFHLLYQYWIHTEMVPNLGPLEWVLNTPSQHRVHHARNPIYVDKNYGGTLCIFDRLFGTFQDELDSEACVYGVIGPLNTFDAVHANVSPYIKVWHKMRTAPTLKLALQSLWERPGWQTSGDELKPPIVNVSTVRKYDTRLPMRGKLYAAFLFVQALVLYSFAGTASAPISVWARHLVCLATYASFVSAGAVLDRKRYAIVMELIRCVMVFAAFAFTLPLSLTLALLIAHALAFSILLYPVKTHFKIPIRVDELSSDGPSISSQNNTRKPSNTSASTYNPSSPTSNSSRSLSPRTSPRGRSPSRRSRPKAAQ